MADTRVLVVFGTGTQARGHVTRDDIYPRDKPDLHCRTVLGIRIRASRRAAIAGLYATVQSPNFVAEADIICTYTTSAEPLFDGRLPDRFAPSMPRARSSPRNAKWTTTLSRTRRSWWRRPRRSLRRGHPHSAGQRAYSAGPDRRRSSGADTGTDLGGTAALHAVSSPWASDSRTSRWPAKSFCDTPQSADRTNAR
jgi:hypothetical protein